jgi:hypothetical protein
MLARENQLLGCARLKPSQGSVPAGLTLASDSSFCFQCKEGSGLVLRRRIETTVLIMHQARITVRKSPHVLEPTR